MLTLLAGPACLPRSIDVRVDRALLPDASARLWARNDKAGGIEVELEATSMPDADTRSPRATAYVLWLQPADAAPRNLGPLQGQAYGENGTTWSITALVPDGSAEVFLTAEPDWRAPGPSGQHLLSAQLHASSVQRRDR